MIVPQGQNKLTIFYTELDHDLLTPATATALADDLDGDHSPGQIRPALPGHLPPPGDRRRRETVLPTRGLCEALELGLLPKNVEGTHSKLKRLVARRIPTETEPGLFTQDQL